MSSKRFSLQTRSGLDIGFQSFNNYGLRSNEKLLLNYGFIVIDNPIEYVYIKLGWSIDDEDKKQKLESLLKLKNLKSSYYLVNEKDNSIPKDLFDSMRIRLFKDIDYYNYVQSINFHTKAQCPYTDNDLGDFISYSNEWLMLNNLHSMLLHKLQKFESTLESDREQLNNINNTITNKQTPLYQSIYYRYNQLLIINQSIDIVQSLQIKLSQHIADISLSYEKKFNKINNKSISNKQHDTLNNYINWLRSIGNWNSSVNFDIYSDIEFSLKCNGNININETICNINFDNVISIYSIPHTKILSKFQENFEDFLSELQNTMEDHMIVLYILMEEKANPSSKWKPFFDYFDTLLPTLRLFMDEQQFSDIQDSSK